MLCRSALLIADGFLSSGYSFHTLFVCLVPYSLKRWFPRHALRKSDHRKDSIATAMSRLGRDEPLQPSQENSREPSLELNGAGTLSHIKRQFISSLVGSSAENGAIAWSPSVSSEGSETDDEEPLAETLQGNDKADLCEDVPPRMSSELVVFDGEGVRPSQPDRPEGGSDRVKPILLCTLAGGVAASIMRHRLGAVCRFTLSGLAMTQLLSILGYATVEWRSLFDDVIGLWTSDGTDGFICNAVVALLGSVMRRCAFLTGVIGGFFVL
ncbi:hypothetical protein, conserved [Trypanosoma brucei gambiense DAL972]|uniref:Uncharacterized protein n=1 Tax=Trypanosoma brucei gambiense (strain MHOM/CI/86/DAL972) TaxID=679716 RepID=C9ZR86_TRYB9|nr:hypothetical protein, conserved [Trypanosoma brucei gambiense DAL972]CBH11916.1 hypothetical protein, conserved [Trypanosoma brucei gambiense DAL972]|eukprot:XP_011774201.1 hypothetical protein, conserved [Trypanosoma brucei gambiense DAL972]